LPSTARDSSFRSIVAIESRAGTQARVAAGVRAEALAAEFLGARGLTIVTRNFRPPRGEIDVIARGGATLVFVEVRLRRNSRYGGAAANITAGKRTAHRGRASLPRARPSPGCATS